MLRRRDQLTQNTEIRCIIIMYKALYIHSYGFFVNVSDSGIRTTLYAAFTFVSEGLAVGVGFGAIGKTPTATFENAR